MTRIYIRTRRREVYLAACIKTRNGRPVEADMKPEIIGRCDFANRGERETTGIKKEIVTRESDYLLSDSNRIQTCNLLIRSQMLYSVKLWSQSLILFFHIDRPRSDGFALSDSNRIQTCNLLIRSQMLYSVKLWSRLRMQR